MDKGFSLVELMVVTAIIGLVSVLTLTGYKTSDQRLALERSTHKLAQDLRRVQEMAVSAKEFEGDVPEGYGILFDLDDTDQYLIFADFDGNQRFDIFGDEIVEIVSLENKIQLSTLDPVAVDNSLTVVFVPPDPSVAFSPDNNTALITLEAEVTFSVQKTVQVNKAGLISIE